MTMDNDEYFKDFKLGNYRFIVVNNIDNPVPLVWKFEQTMANDVVTVGRKELRDPEVIGEELTYYLKERPAVPKGIEQNKANSIEEWFNKEN